MAVQIALLRAVNLGPRARVAMPALRAALEEEGFAGARTLLQSGNVVLPDGGRGGAALERRLEGVLADRMGVVTDVLVRSAREWEALIAANPFPDEAAEAPSRLLMVALREAPPRAAASAAETGLPGPERVGVVGRQAYVFYPEGIGRSKLTQAMLERLLGRITGTARNWNTVTRLAALAAEASA